MIMCIWIIIQIISLYDVSYVNYISILQTIEDYNLRAMVFKRDFKQYFTWPVLLVEESGIPGENDRPATSH